MDAQIPSFAGKIGLNAKIQGPYLIISRYEKEISIDFKQAKELYQWMKENFE